MNLPDRSAASLSDPQIDMARILLIDDNDSVREATRIMLEQSKHEVEELPDGRRAEVVAAERAVDLVITDLVMPEREGIETIRALRNAMPETPVIAISGGGRFASGADYLKSAAKLGAVRTLTKPIDVRQLLDAVEDVLEQS